MNFRDHRKKRVDPLLDLTPLIDVVFLLLIFFLITTTFVRPEESQLPLNLPSAAAGESVTPGERILIFVTSDGSLQIQEEIVRPAEISSRLEELFKKDPSVQLQVKGDKDTSYGYVTGVIDIARQVGFQRVNLVVRRKKP